MPIDDLPSQQFALLDLLASFEMMDEAHEGGDKPRPNMEECEHALFFILTVTSSHFLLRCRVFGRLSPLRTRRLPSRSLVGFLRVLVDNVVQQLQFRNILGQLVLFLARWAAFLDGIASAEAGKLTLQ